MNRRWNEQLGTADWPEEDRELLMSWFDGSLEELRRNIEGRGEFEGLWTDFQEDHPEQAARMAKSVQLT